MPIYEYRCSDCGFQKEYLQRLSEPPIGVCPSCNKTTFAKMLTAAGFHLKGSGWYATDFKNQGSKPAAEKKPDANAAKKPDAKTETKTETKTEAKSDAKPESTPATTD